MKLPIMIAVDFPVLGGASQIRDIWPGEACCPQAGDRVDGPALSPPRSREPRSPGCPDPRKVPWSRQVPGTGVGSQIRNGWPGQLRAPPVDHRMDHSAI